MKILVEWLAKLPERPRTILKTCAYGFVAGLVAVTFQLAINGFYHAGILRLSHCSFTTFLWGSLGLILGTSLISGWLLSSFCTEAAGSGIPQLKAAFWKNFGFVPFRVLWVKFIAAALQIGGGSSLGREGPSVQLAGAASSLLAGLAGEPKQKRRLAAATGAAAGLAAAFNTPLAGVTFVLEELIGDLNSRLLGSVIIGAMTGLGVAGIVQPLFGLSPEGVAMLTIVSMSATLGAVVRAPVTSILIVFEMTHEFSLVPPLMLAAIISQAISRRLVRHNFYDALLEQDGHAVERFAPPRDLREWQKQPVAHLVNPKPVVAASMDLKALQSLLQNHPYAQFPVIIGGKICGVLTRDEARRSMRENRVPVLANATLCSSTLSLREVETRLIESQTGLVLLQDQPDGPLVGILTLHDILRAQQAAAEEGAA